MCNINHSSPPQYTGQARSIHIGHVNLYFSYDTLIGYSYMGERLRRHNDWGPTTGRHINLLSIRDFEEVDEENLELHVTAALAEQCTKTLFT